MAWYDAKLFERAERELLTAHEIGEIMCAYGPDAVTRLRARRGIKVTIAGTFGKGRPKKLYRVERVPCEGKRSDVFNDPNVTPDGQASNLTKVQSEE